MGEADRARATIRQGADYLSACLLSDNEFVVQVGSYNLDLTDYHSPEQMTQARPVYTVNATAPGELPYKSVVAPIMCCKCGSKMFDELT